MAQKEGEVEIVGGNNANGSCVVVSSIIGRQYSDHPQYRPLVAALNSKKHAKLAEKKAMLKLFRTSQLDDIEGYCRDLWREYGRHLFSSIHVNTSTESQINRLTTTFVAEMLADLYTLNDWILDLPPVDGRRLRNDPSSKTKKAFTSLNTFVDTILKKYQEDQLKVQSKKKNRSKVNLQVTGTRIQDTKPFDISYCSTGFLTRDTDNEYPYLLLHRLKFIPNSSTSINFHRSIPTTPRGYCRLQNNSAFNIFIWVKA